MRAVPAAATRGVVVGHDARREGALLAQETAGVLAGHGITVHLLPPLAPTPLVAFAVRHLRAAGGVVITASHNPAEYSGYKVYWEDGTPLLAPHDAAIAEEMAACASPAEVAFAPDSRTGAQGLVRPVGEGVGRSYLDAVARIALAPGAGRDLRVVYTPLHGVGARWVMEALGRAGFGDVCVVPEQAMPDGAFPTVSSPNPEEAGVLDRALALGERKGADLVLANDPDVDRLAVAARGPAGRLRVLTGDDVGALLGEARLAQGARHAARPLVVASIVSSPLLAEIAAAEGALYDETLTGFKWIAASARDRAAKDGAAFVFGYEEALGYTFGSEVWDKDGIAAAVAVADLAGALRARGRTLLDGLEAIWSRYGVHLSARRSVGFPGRAGSRAMQTLMEGLRGRPPTRIGPLAVERVRDYLSGTLREEGGVRALTLPRSNVVIFDLESGARVAVRPSGTEPKAKFYFLVAERALAGEGPERARRRAAGRLERLERDFMGQVEAVSARVSGVSVGQPARSPES
jgi:phosphomannomutase